MVESHLPDTLALAIHVVLVVAVLEEDLARVSPELELDIFVLVEILLAEVDGGLDELHFDLPAGIGERRVS